MGINALTARKLADRHRREQIQQTMTRTITKPVRWVLCWGRIDYRTGKWEWKNEHIFQSRTAALANKNSFFRYPVSDQNACYIVRRYEHGNGHQNTTEAVESIY